MLSTSVSKLWNWNCFVWRIIVLIGQSTMWKDVYMYMYIIEVSRPTLSIVLWNFHSDGRSKFIVEIHLEIGIGLYTFSSLLMPYKKSIYILKRVFHPFKIPFKMDDKYLLHCTTLYVYCKINLYHSFCICFYDHKNK